MAAGRHRIAPVAPELVRQHVAVRQLAARQQLVQHHAKREQIAAGIGRLGFVRVLARRRAKAVTPLLGIDVARRAGVQAAHRLWLVPRQGHAQVEQAQHAIGAQVQVGRLDVAVHHALPVQTGQRTRRLHGPLQHVRHGRRLAALQHLRQRIAGMPVVQQVEGAWLVAWHLVRLVQRDQVRRRGAGGQAARQPGFVRQLGALLGVVRAGRQQGLHHQRTRCGGGRIGVFLAASARLIPFFATDFIDRVDAVVGQHRIDQPAVDGLAHRQPGRHRQRGSAAALVVERVFLQPAHPHHQGGGVVGAAGFQRGGRERLAERLGPRHALGGGGAAVQQRGQVPLAQGAVHAVGEQHEQVAHQQVALRVVDHHALFGAHGARQLVAKVVLRHGVVVREQRDAPAAHQIGARVAHVRQRPAVPAQHQHRERGQPAGRRAAAVGAGQPGVLRRNDAIQRNGRIPRRWRAVVVAHHGGDAGLRRLGAEAAGADAVGNRRDGPVRALARTGQLHAREVFVHALAAGLRIKADIEVEAHVDDEECRFCAALVHAFWHAAAPKRCTFTKG